MKITLTLPDAVPRVSNRDVEGMHHLDLHKKKKKWKYGPTLLLKSQFNSQNMTPARCPVKVVIEYHFKKHVKRDHDNFSGVGSSKWIMDILKHFAWDGDDDSESVVEYQVKIINSDRDETIITITEV